MYMHICINVYMYVKVGQALEKKIAAIHCNSVSARCT